MIVNKFGCGSACWWKMTVYANVDKLYFAEIYGTQIKWNFVFVSNVYQIKVRMILIIKPATAHFFAYLRIKREQNTFIGSYGQ